MIHIIRDGHDAHHARNFGKSKKNAEANAEGSREVGKGEFSKDQLGKLVAEWAARVVRTVRDDQVLLGGGYVEERRRSLAEA